MACITTQLHVLPAIVQGAPMASHGLAMIVAFNLP